MSTLKSQNRALGMEMLRYKRQLSEARRELDIIRGKSSEMESLVSIIQRAWSQVRRLYVAYEFSRLVSDMNFIGTHCTLQLDIDVSMLLDGFGDSEQLAEAGGNTELLFRLLHAGMEYHPRDPANESAWPKMDVDEWSASEDIEKARAIAERVLKRSDAAPSSSSSSSGSKSKKETEAADEEEMSAMDVEFGGKVEETLRGHAHFTLSLLERLCFILSDTGMVEQLPESLGAIGDATALHTETTGLRERITKLSGMILELQSRLFISEKQKRAAERAVDRATVDRSTAGPAAPAPAPVAATAAAATTHLTTNLERTDSVLTVATVDSAPPVAESVAIAPVDLESDGDMYRKIAILEKQLAESETAKAKAEMTLTERLARPLSQTEAQVADMRRAMEDLRHQGRQRVAALITEGIALQDRVADLEEALLKVEAISQAKCAEITAATEREIQRVDGEKKAAESALHSARAELATTNQLKHQVGELQSLESTARSECTRLQQLIVTLTASQEVLQRHLVSTRTREFELEKKLAIDPQASSGGADKEELRRLALTQAQARAQETQIELDDARNQMNDLILEIESVTVEDGKSREQHDRVLRQMTDSQSMQRGVLDENLHLHDQISELHRKQSEVGGRIDQLPAQLKNQDGVISQLRAAEGAARTEIQGLRKTHSDEHSQRILNEQLVVEAEQKLKLAEHSMELAKKRNAELQTRCNELSGQMETERKARMDAQREMKLKIPKRDRKDDVKGAGTGAGAESDMLEMTLGMLRCSVCKDRFKDCAITRCFHLFCKECIDENLRQRNSRHRKCPACGEKFSQEDVKSVFFTH